MRGKKRDYPCRKPLQAHFDAKRRGNKMLKYFRDINAWRAPQSGCARRDSFVTLDLSYDAGVEGPRRSMDGKKGIATKEAMGCRYRNPKNHVCPHHRAGKAKGRKIHWVTWGCLDLTSPHGCPGFRTFFPARNFVGIFCSTVPGSSSPCCCCYLHIKPFFLPNDIRSTRSVRLDSSSQRDTNYMIWAQTAFRPEIRFFRIAVLLCTTVRILVLVFEFWYCWLSQKLP